MLFSASSCVKAYKRTEPATGFWDGSVHICMPTGHSMHIYSGINWNNFGNHIIINQILREFKSNNSWNEMHSLSSYT